MPEPTEKEVKKHTIERSKTSRASCRDCGGVIAKGDLRFGLVDFNFSDHGSYKYFHLSCGERRRPRELAEALSRIEELAVTREEVDAALRGAPESGTVQSPSGDDKSSAPSARLVATPPPWLDKIKKDKSYRSFATDIAPPFTKDGHLLDEASAVKLVTTMKDGKASAAMEAFDAWLDPTSFRDFVWRLFEAWARGSGHMRDKWLFRHVGRALDARSALRMAQLIEGWIKESRRSAAEAGIELLESNGSQSALQALQGLAQRFHYKGDNNLAAQALARVAAARGTTVDDLEDCLVPTLGLDEDGARVFDYGPRRFTLRISSALKVEVTPIDDDAPTSSKDRPQVLHGLPVPRKTDDREKVDSAKRAFETLRVELEKTLRIQSVRLEHALSSGRLWDSGAWDQHLRRHPVLKHLAQRLVWAAFEEDAVAPTFTFVVDEADLLMNVNLDRVELIEGKVGLVHPAELDSRAREAWMTVLRDFEIIQPFQQLARPVFGVPKSDADGDTLRDYSKLPIAPGPLHGVLNRAGWVKSVPEDMRVLSFHKRFETQNVTGVIKLDPGLYITGAGDELQTPVEAFFIRERAMGWDEPDRVPLTDVGSIAISEVLNDLDALTTAAANSGPR